MRNTVTGSAWALASSLDLAIPLGDVFELTPQAGYTFGAVGASFTTTAATRTGRQLGRVSSFSDNVRGSWLSLQVTATF